MKAYCSGCERRFDAEDLEPDCNGDLSCSDCLTTWADRDDVRDWRRLASV